MFYIEIKIEIKTACVQMLWKCYSSNKNTHKTPSRELRVRNTRKKHQKLLPVQALSRALPDGNPTRRTEWPEASGQGTKKAARLRQAHDHHRHARRSLCCSQHTQASPFIARSFHSRASSGAVVVPGGTIVCLANQVCWCSKSSREGFLGDCELVQSVPIAL